MPQECHGGDLLISRAPRELLEMRKGLKGPRKECLCKQAVVSLGKGILEGGYHNCPSGFLNTQLTRCVFKLQILSTNTAGSSSALPAALCKAWGLQVRLIQTTQLLLTTTNTFPT